MTAGLTRAKRIYNAVTTAAQKRPLVKADIIKLEKASSLGLAMADYALSFCYKDGLGVEKDARKSFIYMKKAADLSVPNACYNTALNYEAGFGVKIDLQKAFHYYFKGSLMQDDECIFEYYRCLFYGIGINKRVDLAKLVKQYMFTDATRRHARSRREG